MNYICNIHLSMEQFSKTCYQLLCLSDVVAVGYYYLSQNYLRLFNIEMMMFLMINFPVTFEKALAVPSLFTDKSIVFLKQCTEIWI